MTTDTPSLRPVHFEFRATGGEYFRIWIVNLLLSIVTLGIYSAWAKVRRLRYFHGSTYLDGHAFDYHASPRAILIGRVLIVVVYGLFVLAARVDPLFNVMFLPLLLFGYPWVIMRSRRFHLRMTSWRGLRFDFQGEYPGAFKAYTLWNIAAVLSLGTVVPFYLRNSQRYLLDNTAYGAQPATLDAPIKPYYKFYLLFGLRLIVLFFFAGLVAAALAGLINTVLTPKLMPLVISLPLLVAGVASGAWFRVGLFNLAFNNLRLGPHRFHSTLKDNPLAWLMVKNLVLIVLTLGLYTPWAKVSVLRYQFDHLTVLAAGDLGEFTAKAGGNDSQALADEISDFFNVDVAL